MHVSVIVPAHDAAATIEAQLQALALQRTSIPHEVIVVLNRCSDDTAALVERWARHHPEVRSIVANDRAGASHARNVGVMSAAGDLLLFCDADDIVDTGWLDGMAAALDGADLVGGALDPMPGTDPEILRLFPGYARQQRDGLVANHTILYAMTASMACTRTAFETFGGFDERLAYGSDDVVPSLRAQQAGLRVGFAADARCQYRVRSDIAGISRQRRSFARSNVIYETLYYPAASRPISFEIVMLAALAVRGLLAAPTASRPKWVVHVRAQLARLRASVQVRLSLGGVGRHSDWSSRPGFFVVAGRMSPPLRRLRAVQSSMRSWARRQPLVDYTILPDARVLGGLGLRSPFTVARKRWDAHFEDALLECAESLVDPGDHVVDVGAGVGEFTIAAALLAGESGIVRSFEATPALADAWSENVARHVPGASCHLDRVLVGSTDGEVDVGFSLDEGGDPSIVLVETSRGARSRVPSSRLDSAGIGRCDILKISARGDEPAVIRGADQLIRHNPQMDILVEVDPFALRRRGWTLSDVTDLLASIAAPTGLAVHGGKQIGDGPVTAAELGAWSQSMLGSGNGDRVWLQVARSSSD